MTLNQSAACHFDTARSTDVIVISMFYILVCITETHGSLCVFQLTVLVQLEKLIMTVDDYFVRNMCSMMAGHILSIAAHYNVTSGCVCNITSKTNQ